MQFTFNFSLILKKNTIRPLGGEYEVNILSCPSLFLSMQTLGNWELKEHHAMNQLTTEELQKKQLW